MNAVKQYLAEIGRKGGQKSRRKLTKAQARAMVRARTAKRAALRPNSDLCGNGGRERGLPCDTIRARVKAGLSSAFAG